MKGAIGWFVDNPVAANLMMLTIVVGGIVSVLTVEKEIFPEFSPNTVSVSVLYPGASPDEIEESICARIEEEILSVDSIDEIKSTAADGIGIVNAELILGSDTSSALDDIKARVDALDTLPENAEQPIITELIPRRQTLAIAISGDMDEKSLRNLGLRVRDEVAALDGITQVELTTTRPPEVSIEVSEFALRRFGLTFDDVVRAVQRASIDLPGGSVETRGGEILFRANAQADTAEEFADIVLWTRADGSKLRLREVAEVIDGFEDTEEFARFDGKPAVLVNVFRVGKQDALEISATVRDYIERKQREVPEGVTLTPWRDEALMLQDRLSLLIWNGLIGFLLVFAVLTLFLRFQLAIWVSLGIPISFLGAIWVMPALGTSVNMLSLFAFILVLGIVVDDAIVVGEAVFTENRAGARGKLAAVRGARRVAIPVTFGILTTIAAFLPMFNIPGPIGVLWAVIPTIVVSTLVFSMIESKLILPAHLRHLDTSPPKNRFGRAWSRFQRFFADGLETVARKLYRPVLHRALERRYLTGAIATGVLIVSLGLVFGGYVRFVFFPPVDAENVVIDLTMPAGTPAEQTYAELERIEAVALSLHEEFPGDIQNVMTTIGSQPFRKVQDEGGGRVVRGNSGGHYGEVNIQLAPSEERSASSKDIENRWRELTGEVPGAVELKFSSSLISVGADFEVQLRGKDTDTLRAATARLEAKLRDYPALSDVSNSYRDGKVEIELVMRDDAKLLGLDLGDVARQVRQGFYGAEAQRIQRGRDDVKIMVRYPEAERRSIGDLERMRIRTPGGDEIPFETVADLAFGRGAASIERIDGQRVISVTAEVDKDVSDATTILADLGAEFLPRLVADYDGVTYSVEGEQQEQADTFQGLGTGGIFALFLIFGLMAIPFRSYLQPLIVMSVIPFGLVGAVVGHLLMDMELSILSLCGIVALAGVVVNDSLVLVDFVNQKRSDGEDLLAAVREAGVARFRPILLTSLTTFAGLFPLLQEKSLQAQFLVPMAVSLAFGVLFATLITLVLIPVVYVIIDDVNRAWRWIWS